MASGPAHEPLSTLRGAGVDVHGRRVAAVAAGVSALVLGALVVAFTVAGIEGNDRIDRLRQHGVAVPVVVTGCTGLLGGSGSNVAGYACTGSFRLAGRRYEEAVPGDVLLRPGTVVRGVVVPGRPPLFSTASVLADDHASPRVFVVPAVLLAVLVLLGGVLGVRWRRGRQPARASPRRGASRRVPERLGGAGGV